jgi:hypothetical protein
LWGISRKEEPIDSESLATARRGRLKRGHCNTFTVGFGADHKPVGIHWVRFATRDPLPAAVMFYCQNQAGAVEVDGSMMNFC